MSCHLKIIIITLFSITVTHKDAADLSTTYRKFVYQKDMSEYCRRRVMPSVFLGRQVVDANSQILHFSRLEVPYSCYVNVRTEMGSNIIVVIQVITDIDLQNTCKQGDNQLLIYELGETFGGYWGQLPDSVMKRGKPRNDRSYTLKTTVTRPVTKTTKSSTLTTTTETQSTTKEVKKGKQEDTQEYLTVELPIVNVSAKIVPGKLPVDLSFSTEDNFEIIYDVVPESGTSYDTTMLPLLEVSVEKNKGRLREGDKLEEVNLSPEFQVQFNDLFTPDSRLTLPEFEEEVYKTKSYIYHPFVNRRLNFKKSKFHFVPNKSLFNKKLPRPNVNRVQSNSYLSKIITQLPVTRNDEAEYRMNSWAILHDILKNLTNVNESTTQPPHKELAKILQGISNREFNKSVYLEPAVLDKEMTKVTTVEHGLESLTTMKHSSYQKNKANNKWHKSNVSQDSDEVFNKSNVLPNNTTVNNKEISNVALLPLALDVDSIILNVTNQKHDPIHNKSAKRVSEMFSSTNSQKLDAITVPLVNHESWDNIVNVAPVMVVKLNHTKTPALRQVKEELNVTKSKLRNVRKKRYIHAIDIEIANPHHVQIMKHMTTTSTPEKFDMREFQRLIELQDDEIQDRVAMRYLRKYVGLPLLNFCDFNETATRHVYLFNSSRLVLALSNFTLKRMTVVVTPARTLLNSDARCAAAYLECQVSGARVCIDSHSACDGVPNCGSYDIYDEDRLRCGAAAGLRHNVCLAAITFLAVLLTILYTIHYWLKRCVPRVSDAFFIYTDAAENVLFLESVMRSPHDVGVSKDFFRGTMQQFMDCEDIVVKENIFKTFFNKCFLFLRCKRKKNLGTDIVEADLDNIYTQRVSNFAEMDINRIAPFNVLHGADVAVQTDSSLEVDVLELSPNYSKEVLFEQDNIPSSSVEQVEFRQVDNDSNQPSDELNILKFFRQARAKSTSSHRNLNDEMVIHEMSVLKLHKNDSDMEFREYDPDHYSMDQSIEVEEPIKSDVSKDLAKMPGPIIEKHLRFQDDTVIIPLPHEDDEENVESAPSNRRSIVFGANKVFRIQENEPKAEELDEPSGGTTAREFKSYFNWGSGKEKKKKKPKKK